jgi:hypothetical protein
MTHDSGRDFAMAAGATVLLAATLVVPWRLHALAFASVTLVTLAAVFWVRGAHDILRQRIAGSAIAGFAGFAATFFAVAETSAAAFVLGLAVIALLAAGLESTRLRGAPVPENTEANGRVAFEGTVYAVGESPHVPGTDRDVAIWIARHERRLWRSASRFEIRSDRRRVLVDPARARVRSAPWLMSGATWMAAAATLGVDISGLKRYRSLIRVWSFGDGDRVYVVGRAGLDDDPSAPMPGDRACVTVFAGDLVIGAGGLTEARRRARVRLGLSAAIAIGAGSLVAASLG